MLGMRSMLLNDQPTRNTARSPCKKLLKLQVYGAYSPLIFILLLKTRK